MMTESSTKEQDRRDSRRYSADVKARWHGLLATREGNISDISASGCFILTGGEVSPGELVSLEIDLPGLLRLQLWGKVVYHIADMGFAVRFKDLSITDTTLLGRLISYVEAGLDAANETPRSVEA